MELPTKQQIIKFQEKIRKDPVFFVENVLSNPLWEKQREILEAVRDNSEVAIRSCHASGKGVAIDTPILTNKGWKEMKDLSVDDFVFDESGKKTKVLFVHPVREIDCFEVTFDNGEKIICDTDHLWAIIDWKARHRIVEKNRKINKDTDWRENWNNSETLNVKDLVIQHNHQTNNLIPLTKEIQTKDIELELDPYTFGVWLGDGTSIRTEITDPKMEMLPHIPYKCSFRESDKRIFNFWEKGDGATLLKRLGVHKNKHIPNKYLLSSPKQRYELICGLMDSDGHCDKNGNVELCFVSERLARDAVRIISSMGWKVFCRVSDAKLYGRYISKRYRISFTSDKCPFKLERKAKRWRPTLKQKPKNTAWYIKEIKRVRSVKTKCITVANSRGLFLIGNNLIPTHNSYIAGRIVHWYLNSYKDSIVITTAPTFTQVKEVLWREIKSAVRGKKIYPEKAILDTAIHISDKWFAMGRATDKPDSFQGFHSPHLMVLIDEASGIEPEIEEAIDGLTPEKIVRIGQPLSTLGRFAKSFSMEGVKKMQISAYDTPNVREHKIVIPGLITETDLEKFRIRYGENSNVWRVRVLGEFPTQDSDSLISVQDVYNAIQRTKDVPSGFEKKMGVDVARFGDDRTVILIRQMEKVIRKEFFNGIDTMGIVGKILSIAKEEKVLSENIFIDEIGVGAGVIDRMKEQGWKVVAVNVSKEPEDKEHYINLRAELYDAKVKEWIKTADIPNDDDFYELTNIKYKFNSNGKMQIESKQDLKNRGLNSPDVADALMLTFASKGLVSIPSQSMPSEDNYYYPALGL